MRGLTFLFLVLCGVITSCGPDSGSQRVIVLQTGRLSGNVYPLESRQIAPLQHYPYLGGYVKQVRREAEATGARVLLVDSGDSLSGSFASHISASRNMVVFFNSLNYDAIFLSNLDADVPPEALKALQMPVLSPFMDATGQSVPAGCSPLHQVEIQGLRVQLLANFYGDTRWEDKPTQFPMWFGSQARTVRPVRDYQTLISSAGEAQPDLSLFHWTKFPGPGDPSAWVHQLTQLGVDALLAHRTYSSKEQTRWETADFSGWPLPVNENILRQNGGFTLARLDLIRGRDGRWMAPHPHQVIQMTANSAPADMEISELMKPFHDAISTADRSLGVLPDDVSPEQVLNAYFTALSTVPHAQALFYSEDSIRSPLSRGKLNTSHVYQAIPWSTPLERVRISSDLLPRLLEIKGTQIWVRPGQRTDTDVITSRFFARIIQRHLNLPDSAVEAAGPDNEFEFFCRFLESRPLETVFTGIPQGWEALKP